MGGTLPTVTAAQVELRCVEYLLPEEEAPDWGPADLPRLEMSVAQFAEHIGLLRRAKQDWCRRRVSV